MSRPGRSWALVWAFAALIPACGDAVGDSEGTASSHGPSSTGTGEPSTGGAGSDATEAGSTTDATGAATTAGVTVGTGTAASTTSPTTTTSGTGETPAPYSLAPAYFWKGAPANLSIDAFAQAIECGAVVLTHGDEAEAEALLAEGLCGPLLVYVLGESLEGPALTQAQVEQLSPCTDAQWAFTPYRNQILFQEGDFCTLWDALVAGASIVVEGVELFPTKAWFLTRKSDGRLLRDAYTQWDDDDAALYYLNFGNADVQQFFALQTARLLHETGPASGWDGVCFDNVPTFSWFRHVEQLDVGGEPVELPTESEFRAAVIAFFDHVSQALRSEFPDVYLCGNFIDRGFEPGAYSPNDALYRHWDAFRPMFDAAFFEEFAHFWGAPSEAMIPWQLAQITSWQQAGGAVIGVSQSEDDEALARQTLALALIVAGGETYVRHSHSSQYSDYWPYPQLWAAVAALGEPLAAYTVETGGGTTTYRRDFQHGTVQVDVAGGVITDAHLNVDG